MVIHARLRHDQRNAGGGGWGNGLLVAHDIRYFAGCMRRYLDWRGGQEDTNRKKWKIAVRHRATQSGTHSRTFGGSAPNRSPSVSVLSQEDLQPT